MDEKFPNRMLLAEANQWPEDAVAYFGNGRRMPHGFHFPVMPRLFMAIHMEDRFPILDIMAQTPAIPENCQWCMFLRNHDELTLEMVTDEERDYMYRRLRPRSAARINLGIRHRLAPAVGQQPPPHRADERPALLPARHAGHLLRRRDRHGRQHLPGRPQRRPHAHAVVRRPQRRLLRANPQRLYLPVIIDPEYHYEAINVEAQQNNPNSLLWWIKRLIALRKRHKAFGRGTLEFLHPANRKVLAFVRCYQEENILVVANLSRFVQHVELDLAAFRGIRRSSCSAAIRSRAWATQPYPLTLGPHAFYWFSLEQPAGAACCPKTPTLAPLADPGGQRRLGAAHPPAEQRAARSALPAYLQQARWLGGGAVRKPKSTIIRDAFRLRYGSSLAFICLVDVEFTDGSLELYLVPLDARPGGAGQAAPGTRPRHRRRPARRERSKACSTTRSRTPGSASPRCAPSPRADPSTSRGGELVTRTFGPIEGLDVPEGSLALGDHAGGADQHLRRLRRPPHPQVLPPAQGRHPPRGRGRPLLDRDDRLHNAAPVLGAIEFRSRRSRADHPGRPARLLRQRRLGVAVHAG